MEAIILKKVPFNEEDAILTLFTAESGLVSVMKKSDQKKQKKSSATTSVLSRIECDLRKGRGELYYFRDLSLLDAYLDIRSDYDRLHAAGRILRILTKTQFKDKSAESLFQLTKAYFEALKQSENPKALLMSFYLKLLRFEGLFSLEDLPSDLTQKEREDLIILAGSRKFDSITSLSLDGKTIEVVESLLAFHFNS